jgi:glutaredoxin-like protein
MSHFRSALHLSFRLQEARVPKMTGGLAKRVRELFDSVPSPVRVVVFTTSAEDVACEMCEDTRQLVEELAMVSGGKVLTEVHDVVRAPEVARRYGVDKVPALVVLTEDGKDHGIRFFGPPSGYEFATLIEDIRMVSTGASGLSPETLEVLSRVSTPLKIRVFVTPTCPYCPRAVLLAHRMALASDFVTAEMIDAAEFPEVADRYQVYGVPRTVINDTVHIEGAVPESALLAQMLPLVTPARS